MSVISLDINVQFSQVKYLYGASKPPKPVNASVNGIMDKNHKSIKNCIKNKISFLNNNEKLKIRNIDSKFPNYIVNNKSLFKKWISK